MAYTNCHQYKENGNELKSERDKEYHAKLPLPPTSIALHNLVFIRHSQYLEIFIYLLDDSTKYAPGFIHYFHMHSLHK